MVRRLLSLSLCLVLSALAAGVAAGAEEYIAGGPLAGLKLEPFPTQHGERPGYPGCLPEKIAEAEVDNTEGWLPWSPVGLAPEWHLYDGSVEHWRAYWFKYCPVRSMFDRQSQVKNFVAPNIPGADARQVAQYAEPIYWIPRYSGRTDTGKRMAPVPVVRCTPGDPVFDLDLGTLDRGMYVVRVIGAVPADTKEPPFFLDPIFMTMTVNDGLAGEPSTYRRRIAHTDQFYSVAEFFFNAPARRAYRATVAVDKGSEADLLVHNISLDSALAGSTWQVVKQRTTLAADATFGTNYSENYTAPRTPVGPEERLARDAAIWNAFPALNSATCESYRSIAYQLGIAEKPIGAVREEHGEWKHVSLGEGGGGRDGVTHILPKDLAHTTVLMRNDKLKLEYTLADLAANKPLPDPYPFKDDGTGLVFPEHKHAHMPIAWAVSARIRQFVQYTTGGGKYFRNGVQNPDYPRDAAIALARFAYAFPAIDMAHSLPWILHDPGPYGRDLLRRRPTMAAVWGNFIRFLVPVRSYDELYDYIAGNEDLAQSIHRFVPWVETPEDVLTLLDVYLVQTTARRMMRYQYYGDGRQPSRMAELATLVGNNAVTDDWMNWLFSRTFFYPNAPSGLQDLMITGTDRDGMSPIGSYAYMIGEASGARIAEKLETYLRYGGNPEYDLRNPRKYPKVLVSSDFDLRSHHAGLYFPRLGDVSGPDKAYGYGFHGDLTNRMERLWRWTEDPRAAYVLKHAAGSKDPAVLKAAETVKRAPWNTVQTRVLAGWSAFLESGIQHDDFRFRRSALMRTGWGWGHAHYDVFDLQVTAHGVPLTINPGQRGGYSDPGDRNTFVHNTVTVDGHNWLGHNWVRNLASVPGAHMALAQAAPKFGTRLFRRQVALIDVDEGNGSRPLGWPQVGPQPKDMPAGVTTANSYVFDVFRVAGGAKHEYGFHGSVNDPEGPQPESNAADIVNLAKPADPNDPRLPAAVARLGELKNNRYFGTAPETLEVTFPLQKTRVQPGVIEQAGTESFFLRGAYDPEAPDKFLKWRLFNTEGRTFMKGDLHCHKWGYHVPLCFLTHTDEGAANGTESAFVALLEPYAGEPFIESAAPVAVADNETDALRAVALQVVTTNGHTDLLFSDGRPETTRSVGDATLSGEFALVSRDADGIRLAMLTGGRVLEAPGITLKAARREHTGEVVEVDYVARTVTLDTAWPALAAGQPTSRRRLVEIGTLPGADKPGYVTAYEPLSITPQGPRTLITMRRGATFYRSRIIDVKAEDGVVTCALGSPGSSISLAGLDRHLVASDDDRKTFWRADVLPGDRSTGTYPFRLLDKDGRPDTAITEAAFAPAGALRLWEYGVGDTVRRSTLVTCRRTDAGTWLVDADVDCTVTLAGRTHTFTAGQFADGPVEIK